MNTNLWRHYLQQGVKRTLLRQSGPHLVLSVESEPAVDQIYRIDLHLSYRLKDLKASELGGLASKAALATLPKETQVDSVVFG